MPVVHMPVVHVISPSHLHVSSLSNLPLLPSHSLVHSLTLHSFMGLPLSSPIIPQILLAIPARDRVVLLVPDFRFGNYSPSAPPRTLNVCRSQCNASSDASQVSKGLLTLSALRSLRPDITLVPWDLMVRKSTGTLSYADLLFFPRSFSPSLVDVEAALAGENIPLKDAVLDRGGHPSLKGLSFLVNTVIFSSSPPPPPSLLLLLTTPRTLLHLLLILHHRATRVLLLPLQRRLSVIRPRRTNRGSSPRLLLSHLLISLYQLHLYITTLLSRLSLRDPMAVFCGGHYVPSVMMVVGWREFREGSPPLLPVT